MQSAEFKKFRKLIKKTQKQMAQLLGTSLKAVHSYEQGWRTIPAHVERQMYFLLFNQRGIAPAKACWSIKKCNLDHKTRCPAWEFKSGKLCWFINGTVCSGVAQKNWKEKMVICRTCDVFTSLMAAIFDE